ncbi:hypothetical protein ACSBR1_029562 [Camellia fascicularis]
MASDGQKDKMGNDTPAGSGRPIDLDVEEDNRNIKTRDQNHGVKDVGQTGDVPKKPDRSGYNNEDNLQPSFPLQDTSIPAADAQKGGQKIIPITPQHTRSERHSHRPSREVGRGESRREESRRTYRTKEADPKERRHVQGQVLCFDTPNGEGSKRARNEAESSAPKRLKSGDN